MPSTITIDQIGEHLKYIKEQASSTDITLDDLKKNILVKIGEIKALDEPTMTMLGGKRRRRTNKRKGKGKKSRKY